MLTSNNLQSIVLTEEMIPEDERLHDHYISILG